MANDARLSKNASDAILGLKSKEDVLNFLTKAGFSVSRAAQSLFVGGDEVGAILVGSVAEGYQTRSSDIDILFVSYADRGTLNPSTGMVISAGQSSETLQYASGIEINAEVVCYEDYSSLAGQLDRVAGAAAMGGELSTLPILDDFALRFLHRLRSGVVLFGGDVVDQFRADFHVGTLPLYLAVENLVLARERLEDARSASIETVGLVEYICRNIRENCLLALAASHGFTSQSQRFVMNWVHGLPADTDHYAMFLDLRDQTLESRILSTSEKAELLSEVTRTFEETREALREDPVIRQVTDRIFEKISYAY